MIRLFILAVPVLAGACSKDEAPEDPSTARNPHKATVAYMVMPDFWPEQLGEGGVVVEETTAPIYRFVLGSTTVPVSDDPLVEIEVNYDVDPMTVTVPTSVASITGDDPWPAGALRACTNGFYVSWDHYPSHPEYRRQQLATRVAFDACAAGNATVHVR